MFSQYRSSLSILRDNFHANDPPPWIATNHRGLLEDVCFFLC